MGLRITSPAGFALLMSSILTIICLLVVLIFATYKFRSASQHVTVCANTSVSCDNGNK